MHMPISGGFKYIVQGCCSLTGWPEFHKLCKENAKSIGDWIFEDVLCRWGSLHEIITNNGTPFIKVLEYLADKYKIIHIHISGYNHHANSLVEQSHSMYDKHFTKLQTVKNIIGCLSFIQFIGQTE